VGGSDARVGGSTGTNFVGMLYVARRLKAGQSGAIVGLPCDSGERERNTYYDDAWMWGGRFRCRSRMR
jgi:cysteine synthase A